jgi:uncharacterized protein YbcV (DUF1398 family)
MDVRQITLARQCLEGAEQNTMTFPQIVGTLMDGGFESYAIDYRRATATYYLASGENAELPIHDADAPVGEAFDPVALKSAILEAQTLAPGYTYKGFCAKAKAAGCAGYMVSFTGRRALYFGRTAETHVEFFPPL